MKKWPDPTPEMLKSPEFNAVWEVIKTWDINVPEVDGELYSEATGNHVRAILDGLVANRSLRSKSDRSCGHPEENHGPVGELAPGRRFNFNIFGDCDEDEE